MSVPAVLCDTRCCPQGWVSNGGHVLMPPAEPLPKHLLSVVVWKLAVGWELGAHLFAPWVHVRALISSSSKPHWTWEQPRAQMIQVYLRRVLRKMQQKIVQCVPLKAPLKGSGSLMDVPWWDSRRTQSPSMHPALLGRWPPASEPRQFMTPRGN